MADTLTRTDVERIATLARLELTPGEVTLFADQLTAILAYADQIQQVDTSGIVVGVGDAGGTAPGRDDVPAPSLDLNLVLGQAPAADRAAGLFKVPRVIGS
jgi:aspartyl-tRNA(Asn)/glutamyl-tRNA(Gln) amidotransferase subunit C